MSKNAFLTNSLIEAIHKSNQIFLFAGPKDQILASPSITSFINEHDVSLWDQLARDEFEARETAMKVVIELLQRKGFRCTLSKVDNKLYITSFKNT